MMAEEPLAAPAINQSVPDDICFSDGILTYNGTFFTKEDSILVESRDSKSYTAVIVSINSSEV